MARLAALCMIGAGLTGFASTDAAEVNAADAVAAIQDVAPQAVAGAIAVGGTADAAVQASTADGVKVKVPVDAAAGVQATLPGGSVSMGLPFAEQATDATASPVPGVVVYDNKNGSSTVPVVRADGTVQISTVIENAKAPKRYDYPVTVPEGQSLQLAPDGSAFVGRVDGQSSTVSAVIAAPWAKDAEGNAVATHYEIGGNTLTQVVDFTPSTAFPVVADPSVTFGTYVVVTMSQATAQAINAGSAGTAIALLALTGPIGAVIGAAVYSTIGGYSATRLSQCRNWAFSYTYLGQLVKAGCA
ncbi:hypothetical protein [Leifsonia virtsii]|uniref:Uncharacterized protein n=1 Tax=Leifsonia virtsii TaxID=3035915 RepID=A0ABT8J3F7_9MICO|nr:hypothetical protein [Leifsonia virtsii]MDN4598799.1 hypothetical protein [Leifsonia virtsii]